MFNNLLFSFLCSKSWYTLLWAVTRALATRWRWSSCCSAAMRLSSGWWPKCSCAQPSANVCSSSRNSSRSQHSKYTLTNRKWSHRLVLKDHSHVQAQEYCTLFNLGLQTGCKHAHVIFLSLFSCKAQRNLNSFFAIIMGLNSPAVSRLTQTWEVGKHQLQCKEIYY